MGSLLLHHRLLASFSAFMLVIAGLLMVSVPALAEDNLAGLVGGMPALTSINNQDGSTSYSLSLQVLALMTALTLLPSIILGMTSFTRIIIVLSILRQAMGTQ